MMKVLPIILPNLVMFDSEKPRHVLAWDWYFEMIFLSMGYRLSSNSVIQQFFFAERSKNYSWSHLDIDNTVSHSRRWIHTISRREPPQLSIGWHNPAVVKNTCMLRVSAEHRISSGGRWGKRHDEEKKDAAGVIRSDTVTPPVIVHGLPPRNL